MNPEVISQSREPDVDRKNWKIVILGLLITASSYGLFHYFNRFLASLKGLDFLLFALTLLVFLVFTTITSIFVKSEWKLYLISFFSAAAAYFVFYDLWLEPAGAVIAGGAIIFLLFLSAGFRGATQSVENSLKIKFFLVAQSITPRITLGISLFISIIFFCSYFLLGQFNEKLGKTVFDQSLTSSEPVLKLWFPAARFDQSIDTFLRSLALAQLKKTNLKISLGAGEETQLNFSQLDPGVQDALLKQTTDKMLSYLESKIGAVNTRKLVREVAYDLVLELIVGLPPQAKLVIGAFIALILFSIIKSTANFLYWIPNSIAFLLFKLLVVLGFAYKSIETKAREFILLK